MKFPTKRYLLHVLLATVAGVAALAPMRARAATVIYVSSFGSNSIFRYSSDGTASLYASGIFDGGPLDLAVDSVGNLFVATAGTDRLMKVTPAGVASGVGSSDNLTALTFDSAGNLWGTSPLFSAVVEFPPAFGTASLITDYRTVRLAFPTGLAFDQAGNLYAANRTDPFLREPSAYANTILKLSPAGADLGFFAADTASGGLAQLKGPWDIAFDRFGRLYASCTDTDTIERFTANGTYLGTFASGLSDPKGMAFDSAGNLYVANSGDGTIHKITQFGVNTVFASGLVNPTSIAITDVPEPSIATLLGLASLVFARRCRRSA